MGTHLWRVSLAVLASGKGGRQLSHPGGVARPGKGPDWWAAGRRKRQEGSASPWTLSPAAVARGSLLPQPRADCHHRALLNSCWVVSCWAFSLLSSPFSVCNNLSGEVSGSVGGDSSQALMVLAACAKKLERNWFHQSLPPWAPPLEWK